MTETDFVRHEPPADLFASIMGQVTGDGSGPSVPPTTVPSAAPEGGRPVVVSLDERRTFRTRFLAVAATVVMLAGVGGYLLLRDDGTGTTDPSAPRVLAAAELEQLEDLGSTAASARLVDEGGRTHLVIDATDMAPPPEGSEYELWLIDTGVTDPRSLGVVTGSEDIELPSNIDPAQYPIVDISLEPRDGNHQHSGHSLMRGTLQ